MENYDKLEADLEKKSKAKIKRKKQKMKVSGKNVIKLKKIIVNNSK